MAGKLSYFLLLSKPNPTAQRIVSQLRSNPAYRVEYENSPKAALEKMSSQKFHCLILNLEQFGFRQYHLVEQIRNLGYKFQILIFADIVLYKTEEAIEKLHNIIIFGKSFIDVDSDLLGICSRFTEGAAKKRVSKRKPSRQKAMVLNLRTGNRFSCMAFNMSTGGAYIEFQAHGLTIGDKLNVVIVLSSLKKTHVIKAKVMWIRTALHGALAAGLQFYK